MEENFLNGDPLVILMDCIHTMVGEWFDKTGELDRDQISL